MLFRSQSVNGSVDQDNQQSSKTRRIPLVLTYHPGLPDISAITRRFLPILHLNPSMKECCPDPPLIAFRRPKNLRDVLVRAKVPTSDIQQAKPTCDPCSQKGPKKGRKCQLCTSLPSQSHITSSATGRSHQLRLRRPTDCDSKNVVYCITCTRCSTINQYVGQTTCFRKRMNNHKSNIRLGKEDDRDCSILYAHFKLPGHSVKDLMFTILETCPDETTLLRTELRWMWTLKTITPSGLNTRC